MASLLCLQGNKTKKIVKMNEQPPITVVDLIPGVVYHLRVYSHEFNSISSKPVTFKTKAGETTPDCGTAVRASWATLMLVVSTVTVKQGELSWLCHGILIGSCVVFVGSFWRYELITTTVMTKGNWQLNS